VKGGEEREGRDKAGESESEEKDADVTDES
jgi:hypothetical protein